ncbi:MAG: soluble lytic transglycosylase B [Gammaproteobacteria bacterium]|nr:MAG: soluble lytic transglycosylase B [Gammaproteobacteria bacterium]
MSLTPASAVDLTRYPQLSEMVDTLTSQHALNRDQILGWLANAKINKKILAAMKRPSERLPWHRYRKLFVTEKSIYGGVEFLEKHRVTLKRAYHDYGVSPEIIVAIIGIESRYGRNRGKLRVLDSLTTLALEYPRRSRFFSSELQHFLVLAGEAALDPLVARGSYAGAMGIPQFMPSSYRQYAVDFDNDGRRDLFSLTLMIRSAVWPTISRFTAGKTGEPVVDRLSGAQPASVTERVTRGLKADVPVSVLLDSGVSLSLSQPPERKIGIIELDATAGKEYRVGYHNFFVITRYNHSHSYAMSVFELAEQVARRSRGS